MDYKTAIILALVCSAGATMFLSPAAARKLTGGASRAYIGLLLSIMVYSLGYALELSNTTLPGIVFSLRLEYIGLSFIPAFGVILAVQYTVVAAPPLSAGPVHTGRRRRNYFILFFIYTTRQVMAYLSHGFPEQLLFCDFTLRLGLAKLTLGFFLYIASSSSFCPDCPSVV